MTPQFDRARIALSITLAMGLLVGLSNALSLHRLSKTNCLKSNKSSGLTQLKSCAQSQDTLIVPSSKPKSYKTYNDRVVVIKASFFSKKPSLTSPGKAMDKRAICA